MPQLEATKQGNKTGLAQVQTHLFLLFFLIFLFFDRKRHKDLLVSFFTILTLYSVNTLSLGTIIL